MMCINDPVMSEKDKRDFLDERVGIYIFDGNVSTEQAEFIAMLDLQDFIKLRLEKGKNND